MNFQKSLIAILLGSTLVACSNDDPLDDLDRDNDGVVNIIDAFPDDPTETLDTDQDGIGNNRDPDDDNDGVGDDQDAFPLDPLEISDFDLDGTGDNADTDDDNDGVPDTDDAFPLNPLESFDLDNDGVGDNTDPDDDNDGVTDEQDNIHIVGFKESYLPGEFVNFILRGFSADNARLLAENGWHTQYYLYDAQTNQRISELTTNGYFNAQYDATSNEWSASFPAPNAQITYRAEVSVYCSLASSDCDSVANNNYTADHATELTVSCAQDSACLPATQPHKATQLTNNTTPQDSPEIIRSDDGTLMVAYRDFNNLLATNLISSVDEGLSWQEQANIPDLLNESAAFTPEGTLIGLDNCDMSICLMTRDELDQVTYQALDSLLVDIEIDEEALTAPGEGVAYPFSHLILEPTPDGGYLIGFTIRKDWQFADSDLYLLKTYDFEEVASLFKKEGVDSGFSLYDVVANSEGNVTAVYAEFDRSFNYTSYIEQGNNLSALQVVASSNTWFQDIEALVVADETLVLVNTNDSIYQLELNNGNIYTGTNLYSGGVQLGFSAVQLTNGDVGIVYEADWNNQRDVFFDTIEASQFE